MKIAWNEKCKCGHILQDHEYEYAGQVIKIEDCNKCPCKSFVKQDKEGAE